MKILHTADWHLGKIINDTDRYLEQVDALEQIVKIADEQEVDIIIIAGDVYQDTNPTPEVEKLFFDAAIKLTDNGNRAVVAISGNHDSPKRFTNASQFCSRFGIHLVGSIDEIQISELSTKRHTYAIECGKGYIKFNCSTGEQAVVACLPFQDIYHNFSKNKQLTFEQNLDNILTKITKKFSDDTINIIVSHGLYYGMLKEKESLEIFSLVGVNENFFPRGIFEKYNPTYVALGHVHQYQVLNEQQNIFYSGGLLNFFFSNRNNSNTNVIVAELNKDKIVSYKTIDLKVKKMLTFKCENLEQVEQCLQSFKNDYIFVELVNGYSLKFDEIRQLKSQYSNLTKVEIVNDNSKFFKIDHNVKKNLTSSEIFDLFVKQKYQKEVDSSVKELFLELMGEEVYEAN